MKLSILATHTEVVHNLLTCRDFFALMLISSEVRTNRQADRTFIKQIFEVVVVAAFTGAIINPVDNSRVKLFTKY